MIVYEAVADYSAAIDDAPTLAVDALEPLDHSRLQYVGNAMAAPIPGQPDENEWDKMLASHGWRRVGPWKDHGGFRTATVAQAGKTAVAQAGKPKLS